GSVAGRSKSRTHPPSDVDILFAVATVLCLALPREVLARPLIRDRLARHPGGPPPALPGPDRPQLLNLLAG
ncbi:MAG TPA: hypothetical protein VJ870_12905, partial [Amycolatopsis sp.]|nr:hypothetical protein [Amycolatopsis sp.]